MVHLLQRSWPQIAPSVSGYSVPSGYHPPGWSIRRPDVLLPPGLPHEHHVPAGLGSGVGAAAGPPGRAGNTGDDAWEVTVAAPGLGSTCLPPGRRAGGAGLAVVGLQDMTGRAVVGDPPWAPPWPGKAAGRLDPLVEGALFARLVVSSPPKNGCRATGDEPPAGPGPGVFDPGLPAAIPVGGRPGSPGLPPSGERAGVSTRTPAPVMLGRSRAMSPRPAIAPGSTTLASPRTGLSASLEGTPGLPSWWGGRSREGPPGTAAPSSPLPPAEDPAVDSRAKNGAESPGLLDPPSAAFSLCGAEGSAGAALRDAGASGDASPEGAGIPEATSSSRDHV